MSWCSLLHFGTLICSAHAMSLSSASRPSFCNHTPGKSTPSLLLLLHQQLRHKHIGTNINSIAAAMAGSHQLPNCISSIKRVEAVHRGISISISSISADDGRVKVFCLSLRHTVSLSLTLSPLSPLHFQHSCIVCSRLSVQLNQRYKQATAPATDKQTDRQ